MFNFHVFVVIFSRFVFLCACFSSICVFVIEKWVNFGVVLFLINACFYGSVLFVVVWMSFALILFCNGKLLAFFVCTFAMNDYLLLDLNLHGEFQRLKLLVCILLFVCWENLEKVIFFVHAVLGCKRGGCCLCMIISSFRLWCLYLLVLVAKCRELIWFCTINLLLYFIFLWIDLPQYLMISTV